MSQENNSSKNQKENTENKISYVDPRIYLSEIERIIQDGKEVVIPVSGGSMSPFLVGGRDYVMLEKAVIYRLKKGDIVLYQRENGQFVLHRIWKIKRKKFYMIGDGQSKAEGPVGQEKIRAVVSKIKRKGKWIEKKSFWEYFFRIVWIRIIPFRGNIRRYWRKVKRNR